MPDAKADWIDEAELREIQSRFERELAYLEEKLGLTGKRLGDEPPARFPDNLDDRMGGAGIPAFVVPPRPVRPGADAKPFPPKEEL